MCVGIFAQQFASLHSLYANRSPVFSLVLSLAYRCIRQGRATVAVIVSVVFVNVFHPNGQDGKPVVVASIKVGTLLISGHSAQNFMITSATPNQAKSSAALVLLDN
jgi:uncharacterized protein YhhL (DUF1145 family)